MLLDNPHPAPRDEKGRTNDEGAKLVAGASDGASGGRNVLRGGGYLRDTDTGREEHTARLRADPTLPWPRLYCLHRLYGPRQLRHEHRRRGAVRLYAPLGDRREQPDGDAHPIAL